MPRLASLAWSLAKLAYESASLYAILTGEFPKCGAPLIWITNSRAPITRTPTKRTPSLWRNSQIVLIRINSKPALYQPQTPVKEP